MPAYNIRQEQRRIKPFEQGFTLIELSIVLVIIGLIVGGVLVGQDLIKAAQVRAEVTQLERYNTAVNTFRGKYNGVPGDLVNGVNFFPSITNQTSTTAGLGNGDGLIETISNATTTCATLNCVSGEGVVFWYELATANLIPDPTTAGSNYTGLASVGSTYVPSGKVGGTITVNAVNGINYWVLANQSGALTSGVPSTSNVLSPTQAFGIDTKIDDGVPNTGTVLMIQTGIPATVNDSGGTPAAATNCGNEGSGAVSTATAYNVGAQANAVNCQLSVRTNF